MFLSIPITQKLQNFELWQSCRKWALRMQCVGVFVVCVTLLCLQETKLINHKSLKVVQENEQHIREIEEILKKDRRYLVLDYMPDERTKLIVTYLEDLDKRGPPPPPTASEPTRRPTKWTCFELQPWIYAAERKLGPNFISFGIIVVQKYWDFQFKVNVQFGSCSQFLRLHCMMWLLEKHVYVSVMFQWIYTSNKFKKTSEWCKRTRNTFDN